MNDAPNDLEKFGRRVRARRKQLGLTIDKLAVKSGVSSAYISHIESGKRDVSLEMIGKLAAGLDVLPAELVGRVVPLSEKGLELARLFDEAAPELRESILEVLRAIKRPKRRRKSTK